VQLDPLTFSWLMDVVCFSKMPVTAYHSRQHHNTKTEDEFIFFPLEFQFLISCQ